MAVSKTHEASAVAEAHAAGARLFGENRVQELVEKAETSTDLDDLRWAVIGPLQSNKVGKVVQLADEFHALDTLKIADALDRRLQERGRSLDVFIQVNSSGEEQKSGLDPAEVPDFAAALVSRDSLRVRGLMTLAVFSDDQDEVAACFARTREVQRQLRDTESAVSGYDELSMGMSGDFELAIAYGATTVRVGQALFGPRA